MQVLPGVRRPMALGFKSDEIQRLITIDAGAAARLPAARRAQERAGGAAGGRRRRTPTRAEGPHDEPARGPRERGRARRLRARRTGWCARAALEEAIAALPRGARARPAARAGRSSTSARVYARLGQPRRRARRLRARARDRPRLRAARTPNLASLLQTRGDLAGAIRAARGGAARPRPKTPQPALNQLGLVLYEDGRLAGGARRASSARSRAQPDAAEAYNNLGRRAQGRGAPRRGAAAPREGGRAAARLLRGAREHRQDPRGPLPTCPRRAAAYRAGARAAPRPGARAAPRAALPAGRSRAPRRSPPTARTPRRRSTRCAGTRPPRSRSSACSRRAPSRRSSGPTTATTTSRSSRSTPRSSTPYLPSRAARAHARRAEGPWRIGFVVTPGHEGVFARCMSGILERDRPARFQVAVVCSRARAGAIAREPCAARRSAGCSCRSASTTRWSASAPRARRRSTTGRSAPTAPTTSCPSCASRRCSARAGAGPRRAARPSSTTT